MLKYHRWPQTQFNHGFQCFTRQGCPQDEWIFCSYDSCVFQPCMCTRWVLETSPSDHYWLRYEVGQRLVLGWFWGWSTLDKQLPRREVAKKNHPNHGGRHRPTAVMVPSSRLKWAGTHLSAIRVNQSHTNSYVLINYTRVRMCELACVNSYHWRLNLYSNSGLVTGVKGGDTGVTRCSPRSPSGQK
jgi:hypothetical protein